MTTKTKTTKTSSPQLCPNCGTRYASSHKSCSLCISAHVASEVSILTAQLARNEIGMEWFSFRVRSLLSLVGW